MALTIDLCGLRPPPPPPELGTPDGGLAFKRSIGSGAEGTVYVAVPSAISAAHGPGHDESQAVAVKVVSGRAYRRCRATRGLWSSLAHPHVVFPRRAWFDDANGRCFVQMELLSTDLLDLVIREGPLSDARAGIITGHLASALEHLHGQGVAHRDVKLENVFVGDDGVAKLGDLGSIAQILPATVPACELDSTLLEPREEPKHQQQHQQQRQHYLQQQALSPTAAAVAAAEAAEAAAAAASACEFVGSTLYAPPEAVAGGRSGVKGELPVEEGRGGVFVSRQDPLKAGDMWSLGVSLYGMAAGCHPWEVACLERSKEFRRFVRKGGAGFFPKTFSPGLKLLLAGLLSLDPRDRPTAADVLADPWVAAPPAAPPSFFAPTLGIAPASQPAPVTPTSPPESPTTPCGGGGAGGVEDVIFLATSDGGATHLPPGTESASDLESEPSLSAAADEGKRAIDASPVPVTKRSCWRSSSSSSTSRGGASDRPPPPPVGCVASECVGSGPGGCGAAGVEREARPLVEDDETDAFCREIAALGDMLEEGSAGGARGEGKGTGVGGRSPSRIAWVAPSPVTLPDVDAEDEEDVAPPAAQRGATFEVVEPSPPPLPLPPLPLAVTLTLPRKEKRKAATPAWASGGAAREEDGGDAGAAAAPEGENRRPKKRTCCASSSSGRIVRVGSSTTISFKLGEGGDLT